MGAAALGRNLDYREIALKAKGNAGLCLHFPGSPFQCPKVHTLYHCLCFARNHVGLDSRFHLHKPGHCLRRLEGCVKMSLQTAFLNVNHRELRVR